MMTVCSGGVLSDGGVEDLLDFFGSFAEFGRVGMIFFFLTKAGKNVLRGWGCWQRRLLF